jgi:zinc protease
MIRKTPSFAALAVLLLCSTGLFAQDPQEKQLEKLKPALPQFKPQEPTRIQFPNGMVVFLQEDHELPLIDGTARIRGGSREIPGTKAGMISIYSEVWRTGGTTTKTGDQLDDMLEARAAKVETGGGVDSTSISLSSLKGDFDTVFEAFVDVLRNPAFREDKLELAKQQIDTGISRRNDEIDDIAGREAAKLGYGTDSPYARVPEYWTVNAVTRQDLVDWHKRTVHPNNIILGLVGDFDSKVMEAKLRKAFGDWPKGPAVESAKVEIKEAKPGIYFVEKEDVNQSTIKFVSLGIRRDNPDYYATRVMNELFGGGFSSRLFSNIRTKQGLAYSVGGGLGASYDHPGLFSLSMGTKSGTTAQAIDALNKEIVGLVKDPGSPEEVQKAKDSILNSFIFEFDSKEKILSERMAYEFYGYPADFLERFRAGIEKTTPADVARVVKKYVDGRQFAILVVGKSTDFDRALKTFGEVHPIDITIHDEPPGTPAAAGSATAPGSVQPQASNAEGKALISKVVTAFGGKAKVDGVKAISQKTSQVRNSPQGELTLESESIAVFPDQLQSVMHTPMGEMNLVVSPNTAFMAVPGQGANDLPSAMKDGVLKDLRREPLFVAQHADDPAYSFTAAGTEKVGDKIAVILNISGDGASTRWLVDDKTGQVVRASYKATSAQGPTDREIDYSDYRNADGLMLPFKRVTKENGQLAASTEVKELKINPAVDPKIFAKP